MPISPDTVQTLAAALLQLNPLLGLTLIWTETHLQERDKEQAVNQRNKLSKQQKRTPRNPRPTAPLERIKKYEWWIFLIFLHSITWPIVAIAEPSTFSVRISLAISILWIALSVGRVISTIILSGIRQKIMFWLAVTVTWSPLWLLILTIKVGPK